VKANDDITAHLDQALAAYRVFPILVQTN